MTGDPTTGMSPEDRRAFFDRADRFLAVANALLDGASPGQISASMLFATARFNAFVAQKQGLPPGELDEGTIAYFVKEYETVLRENLKQVLIAQQP